MRARAYADRLDAMKGDATRCLLFGFLDFPCFGLFRFVLSCFLCCVVLCRIALSCLILSFRVLFCSFCVLFRLNILVSFRLFRFGMVRFGLFFFVLFRLVLFVSLVLFFFSSNSRFRRSNDLFHRPPTPLGLYYAGQGPMFGNLQKGQDVALPDGTVVKPSQVSRVQSGAA